jgi:hypothetical protein
MPASRQQSSPPAGFASFREFYPYYLEQHRNPVSRRLHVTGTLLAIVCAVRGDLTMLGEVLSGRRRW